MANDRKLAPIKRNTVSFSERNDSISNTKRSADTKILGSLLGSLDNKVGRAFFLELVNLMRITVTLNTNDRPTVGCRHLDNLAKLITIYIGTEDLLIRLEVDLEIEQLPLFQGTQGSLSLNHFSHNVGLKSRGLDIIDTHKTGLHLIVIQLCMSKWNLTV